MHFEGFGNPRHRLGGFALARHVFEPHEDESQQTAPDGVAGELRAVAFDDAALFELAYAFHNRRRGHAHLAGDFGVGRPRVLLKNLQYFPVSFVDHTVSLTINE